jgi:hypothetical protein
VSIGPKSSLVDIAFEVCTALDKVGVTAVLTGGSAATFYAAGAYQSADLDFVITFQGQADGASALSELGFEQAADYYRHPSSHFPLEFPPGPLMVGDDLIETWRTERRSDQVLHVLTPTDSCRDRLAALLFWNDRSGLEQALAVALAQRKEINLDKIRDWSQRENADEKFRLFERRLAALDTG